MNLYEPPFIFSSRYRLLRHIIFWLAHIIIFTFIFLQPKEKIALQFFISFVWALIFIIYVYPVLFVFIPFYLLKAKYASFVLIMIAWVVAGWFLNYLGRGFIIFPIADAIGFKIGSRNPWAPAGYLTMNLMAGVASMIVLFKYWMKKQRDYLFIEKKKAEAELQLLKAQVHPHFLFNTLNNIYSFSLENSPKTPEMILKLSSLLSYILYDCKADEVLVQKEIEIMKNYIALEKERYANRLEVSMNIEGDIHEKYIAPLLILPFLENAFKHGTSEQLERPWLSIDIAVKQNMLRCKIVNSKNEMVLPSEKGIGINNVQKRLEYLYPGKHDLKLNDEGDFFVVSLMVELRKPTIVASVNAAKALTET